MTSIKLIVRGAEASAEVQGVLTSGMVGIPVTIEYDEAWDELSKNLVCRGGLGYENFEGVTKTVLGIESTAKVAPEVMIAGKVLYLGIEGYNKDGTKVIPTVWACCGAIREGAKTEGGASEDPTLPIWAQLQAHVDQIPETVRSAVEEAMRDGGVRGGNGNGIQSALLNDDYTLTLNFDDGTSYTTPSIRGATGSAGTNGTNGKDGISVTHSWNGTTLTISSASGTSSANLKGDKGDKGDQGIQGIQGEPGQKGADGAKGDKGDKGDTGATGATGAQGQKGETGQRGTGLLPITTAPSAYTTEVNGLTPAYRIDLSTVKTQASTDEVYAGDTVRQSYYHYPVIYVDASYVYCDTRVSIRGATGNKGADGTTPVKGTDYFTDADKAELVDAVIAALPDASEVSY